jgi:hypothetical protein
LRCALSCVCTEIHQADGAFYGPKIDVNVRDALQREHQCATIQVDFQLPRRFNLEFVNEQGAKERPVMIHRAILGSLERMIAILTEHTAGKWPFWLNPRQAIVIPVSPECEQYAASLQEKLKALDFFVDVDLSTNTLNKKASSSALCFAGAYRVDSQRAVESIQLRVGRWPTGSSHRLGQREKQRRRSAWCKTDQGHRETLQATCRRVQIKEARTRMQHECRTQQSF